MEVVVEVVPKVLRCCAKGDGGCSEGGFRYSRLFGQNALMRLHGHRAWEEKMAGFAKCIMGED